MSGPPQGFPPVARPAYGPARTAERGSARPALWLAVTVIVAALVAGGLYLGTRPGHTDVVPTSADALPTSSDVPPSAQPDPGTLGGRPGSAVAGSGGFGGRPGVAESGTGLGGQPGIAEPGSGIGGQPGIAEPGTDGEQPGSDGASDDPLDPASMPAPMCTPAPNGGGFACLTGDAHNPPAPNCTRNTGISIGWICATVPPGARDCSATDDPCHLAQLPEALENLHRHGL